MGADGEFPLVPPPHIFASSSTFPDLPSPPAVRSVSGLHRLQTPGGPFRFGTTDVPTFPPVPPLPPTTFLLYNMLQKHVTKQSHISTSESAQRPPHSVPPHTLFQDAESPARQLSSHREMTMYSGGGRVEVT